MSRLIAPRHMYRPTSVPHPLEPVVREIASRSGPLDGTKLAAELGAGTINKSYVTVARDVLGYMHCQGKLRRDPYGGLATIRDKMGHCLHEIFTMRRATELVAIRDAS